MVEGKTEMKLHFLHIAKFVALVALAAVITHTLGSRAQGSHQHARPVAPTAKSTIHLDAGRILLVSRPGETVAIEGAVETAKKNEPCHAAVALPPAAGDYAADPVTAGSVDGFISSLADELKSAVTLLRAYSQWIRTSPDPIS